MFARQIQHVCFSPDLEKPKIPLVFAAQLQQTDLLRSTLGGCWRIVSLRSKYFQKKLPYQHFGHFDVWTRSKQA